MAGLAKPADILHYWIGPARDDLDELTARNKLWFGKSEQLDRAIATRFTPTLASLAAGMADDWADEGPVSRLAAIIALDQFSRNIYRGTAGMFENDPIALRLTKDGLMQGVDGEMTEIERIFFYLPLEHSERLMDQALSVDQFEKLVREARPAFRPYAEKTLDYARQHKAVIDQFGRFPHRNALLSRDNTPEEDAYLARPGAGF